MTMTLDELRTLEGTQLPGDALVIEPHENAILEHAVRAPRAEPGIAHPMWFVVISLRCTGISVDELCELAGKSEDDTLLFGSCEIEQRAPLSVGARYRAQARIAATGSRTSRDGSRLDNLNVRLEIFDGSGACMGAVTSVYLFKRGGAQ
ncbi:hypothetical protein [Nocardia huaxiensis]|uniref:N-terminal of MaoC-like dehydratase domain-containing protein n=1 Tax=Nocardia huaxiensis TaxID=2755382 RepID=A0A7D6V9A8_9NOCA|nr:hypothetical protein [Nocardia huaxiensis]QLY28842.1 hypothetical protein H0264_26400 [Nocardia huaxiensis]UFS97681.1 hypothetical protein LPY97_07200 [Nocardia huaxiensis]